MAKEINAANTKDTLARSNHHSSLREASKQLSERLKELRSCTGVDQNIIPVKLNIIYTIT